MLRLRLLWLGARVLGAVSSHAGALFAWQLWFTPWRTGTSPASAAREAGWLADTEPLAVPFGDRTIHGFAAGAGPVVVLVHGWGDAAARMGAFVQPLVRAGYRVVGFDLPAHGATAGRTTNAYEAAHAIRAVGDFLGQVHAVVAHSMGGAETVLALRDGFAVRRVVLLASAVRLGHAVDQFAVMFHLPPAAVAGLRRRIEARFGSGVWTDLAVDAAAATLNVPALIVHDRDDQQVDVADGRLLAAAWPGARLLETAGLGHHRLLRDADVMKAVVSFVTERSDADETDGGRQGFAPAAAKQSASPATIGVNSHVHRRSSVSP